MCRLSTLVLVLHRFQSDFNFNISIHKARTSLALVCILGNGRSHKLHCCSANLQIFLNTEQPVITTGVLSYYTRLRWKLHIIQIQFSHAYITAFNFSPKSSALDLSPPDVF